MIVVLLIVIAAACAWLAYGKGRSPALWFALGLLFSVIALIVIACLAPAQPAVPASKLCPDCGEASTDVDVELQESFFELASHRCADPPD